jgi:RNA polymerase sigma-70 factor (ECF subfamily)
MRCQQDDGAATPPRTDARGLARRPPSARSARPPPAAARTSDERALVRRAQAGDASAFLALVDRYHGSMMRIAEAWGHDPTGAEQTARSAWAALLDRLGDLASHGSVRAGVLRVASEAARTTAPAHPAPRGGVEARREDGGSPFDARGRWTSPPPAASEGGALGVPPRAALREAIAALPTLERLVFTLRDVEGLGPEDAATVAGVTRPAQQALLHRARTEVVRQIGWGGSGERRQDTAREGDGR